jgi:hypothetical protein
MEGILLFNLSSGIGKTVANQIFITKRGLRKKPEIHFCTLLTKQSLSPYAQRKDTAKKITDTQRDFKEASCSIPKKS